MSTEHEELDNECSHGETGRCRQCIAECQAEDEYMERYFEKKYGYGDSEPDDED
jgi:hypothetical protein